MNQLCNHKSYKQSDLEVDQWVAAAVQVVIVDSMTAVGNSTRLKGRSGNVNGIQYRANVTLYIGSFKPDLLFN